MTFDILEENRLSINEIEYLFGAVGWIDSSAVAIQSALLRSTHVITARKDGKLIGLIRSMDDSNWHANIDCLLVHPDYQGQGVATALIEYLLNILKHIPTISVSPNEQKNFHLYEKFGFTLIEDGGLLQKYR